ncbi:sugar ABC transporter permease [Cohnella xylanilytica]|uniref:Carbohydrate ABC transporter permease n=1 Tax=Cohnella xylanilytica TaxID=557555 RepID=A0A841U7X0_9BACL|nr:carbohydrate ABC transporter permease [Cohnella xylanilytica]MBB6695772.1 carbohydrate ABC transporter permease [Cohnella xylanilytica]GIO15487.1 sugar ABC transporter permease [Cohnella xylanilytica]
MHHPHIRQSASDRAVHGIILLFLTGCLVVVAYPLLYVLSSSLSSPRAISAGKVWLLPVEWTLDGYAAVFKNSQIVTGFTNSILYMAGGTALNLVMTVLAAYPLTRRQFAPRNKVMLFFVITMFFSGGLIPYYLLVKELGMIDTRWAMIVPTALSAWNVILMRTYIANSIPEDLHEAASMDGCGDFKYLTKIVLPLSKPILAVIGLYVAVGIWNSYFNALIFLKSADLQPLQLVLRNILILNMIDPTMIKDFDALMRRQGLTDVIKYAVIIVSSAPVLVLYPFVQKYFVRGVMIGAIKG